MNKTNGLLICLLILLVIFPSVIASDCTKEIERYAKMITTNKNLTNKISSIDNFVEDRTEYKSFWHKQKLCTFWESHTGDCTDKANLKVYMLKSIGIKARNVYGFGCSERTVKNNISKCTKWGMHDWYEYYDGKKWVSLEDASLIQKRGNGIW